MRPQRMTLFSISRVIANEAYENPIRWSLSHARLSCLRPSGLRRNRVSRAIALFAPYARSARGMNLAMHSAGRVLSRIAASLLGGYMFVWAFTVLVIALGLTAGVDYDEAQTLAYLLAFLVFLGAFLWAYAASSLMRVWLVLAGGGALMTGAAWLLMRSPA